MKRRTSSLTFAANSRRVVLDVGEFHDRVTVGMFEHCRICRGKVAASICVSLCDDFDVGMDAVLARSSQNNYPILCGNMPAAQTVYQRSFGCLDTPQEVSPAVDC